MSSLSSNPHWSILSSDAPPDPFRHREVLARRPSGDAESAVTPLESHPLTILRRPRVLRDLDRTNDTPRTVRSMFASLGHRRKAHSRPCNPPVCDLKISSLVHTCSPPSYHHHQITYQLEAPRRSKEELRVTWIQPECNSACTAERQRRDPFILPNSLRFTSLAQGTVG